MGQGRLSQDYMLGDGVWTEVSNDGDLEYLLNQPGPIVCEERSLGYYYYRCSSNKSVRLSLPWLQPAIRTFPPGSVVVADGALHRVLKRATGFDRVSAAEVLSVGEPLRVLITRSGGLGDVLLSCPAVRTLKARFPFADISYSTSRQNTRLLKGKPYISSVYGGFDAYDNGPFGLVVDLGWWVETAPGRDHIHRSDLFAHGFGLGGVDSYEFDYEVDDVDRNAARSLVGRDGPFVGIQVEGSIPRRLPSPSWVRKLAAGVVRAGYVPILLGGRSRGLWDIDGCVNLSGKTSVAEMFAVLEMCDVVIAGDSGILHAANALGVPCVGLFGPVDPDLRVRGFPRCTTVSGNANAKCSPCNDWQIKRCDIEHPPCLEMIDREEVLDIALGVR